MIEHILVSAAKQVVKQAVKQTVKTVSKEAKKAIIKKVGDMAKKGMKTAAKKKARQVIKNIEKVGKGAKKATELIKDTMDFLSDVPGNLKSKALGELKEFAKQYEDGQAVLDAFDTMKDIKGKISNPKSAIKSAVKDFLKQAEEDDKKLEDQDKTDDIPFDSPEEAGEFKVDEEPTEQPDEDIDKMREQSYIIIWDDLPSSIKKKPGKLRELLDESSSSSDGTAVQELIESGYKECTLYGLKRFVSEYNVTDMATEALIAEAEQAIAEEVRGYEDF